MFLIRQIFIFFSNFDIMKMLNPEIYEEGCSHSVRVREIPNVLSIVLTATTYILIIKPYYWQIRDPSKINRPITNQCKFDRPMIE